MLAAISHSESLALFNPNVSNMCIRSRLTTMIGLNKFVSLSANQFEAGNDGKKYFITVLAGNI